MWKGIVIWFPNIKRHLGGVNMWTRLVCGRWTCGHTWRLESRLWTKASITLALLQARFTSIRPEANITLRQTCSTFITFGWKSKQPALLLLRWLLKDDAIDQLLLHIVLPPLHLLHVLIYMFLLLGLLHQNVLRQFQFVTPGGQQVLQQKA